MDVNEKRVFLRATLTAREAADYLGVSYWLVLELVKRKKIPAVHAGKRVLFRQDSLDSWMASQEANAIQEERTEPGRIHRVG